MVHNGLNIGLRRNAAMDSIMIGIVSILDFNRGIATQVGVSVVHMVYQCAVVGECTSCVKLKPDIILTIAGLCCCKMSSFKSPSITQCVLHSVTCPNSLVTTVINVARGTLGDLYTTAICILPALGNFVVADTASVPLVANLFTLDEFVWLGTAQNIAKLHLCFHM
jgi:hypothetical protein